MRVTGIAILGFMALACPVQATTINFDDGVATNTVGTFYTALGVTFSGATWQTNFGLAGVSGPLGIGSTNANAFKYGSGTPVIATFSTAVNIASIVVIDLGENGFTLNAYDAPTGGTLVGTTTQFGIGLGNNNFQTLSVAAASIFRLEMFQAQDVGIDGVVLENFQFAPEPGTLAVLGFGLAGLGALRRRRKTA